MSNKKLQTIKFPGLNDTYTIPQTYTDVGAASASHTHTYSDVGAASASHTHTAVDVGAVPTSRTVNGKALSSNITLTAADVGALPSTTAIPSDTNDLTNGAGYISAADVPKEVFLISADQGTPLWPGDKTWNEFIEAYGANKVILLAADGATWVLCGMDDNLLYFGAAGYPSNSIEFRGYTASLTDAATSPSSYMNFTWTTRNYTIPTSLSQLTNDVGYLTEENIVIIPITLTSEQVDWNTEDILDNCSVTLTGYTYMDMASLMTSNKLVILRVQWSGDRQTYTQKFFLERCNGNSVTGTFNSYDNHGYWHFSGSGYPDTVVINYAKGISIPTAESDAAVVSMLQSLGLNTTTTLIPATTSNLELDSSVVQEGEES